MTPAPKDVAREIARAMCGDDHLACTYPDCSCKTVPARLPAVMAIIATALAERDERAAKILEKYGERMREKRLNQTDPTAPAHAYLEVVATNLVARIRAKRSTG